jgi:hypothetical protein
MAGALGTARHEEIYTLTHHLGLPMRPSAFATPVARLQCPKNLKFNIHGSIPRFRGRVRDGGHLATPPAKHGYEVKMRFVLALALGELSLALGELSLAHNPASFLALLDDDIQSLERAECKERMTDNVGVGMISTRSVGGDAVFGSKITGEIPRLKARCSGCFKGGGCSFCWRPDNTRGRTLAGTVRVEGMCASYASGSNFHHARCARAGTARGRAGSAQPVPTTTRSCR